MTRPATDREAEHLKAHEYGALGRLRYLAGRAVDAGLAIVIFGGAFVVVTRFLGWSLNPILVLLHSALPVTLLPVWAATFLAAVRHLPVRFVLGLLVTASHVMAVLPVLGSDPLPGWSSTGAPLRIASATVSKENHDPSLGAALKATEADVLVLVELTWPQELILNHEGVLAAYPYRTNGGHVRFGRTVIVSKYPLYHVTESIVGDVSTPLVTVEVGERRMRLIGAHPRAPLEQCCARQNAWLRWARDQGRSTTLGLVIAGDFNASRFVPSMGELFAAGMTDAHEARGKGLSRSWPSGGAFLNRPFMRPDHVLYRGPVVAVAVKDFTVPGSDHRGIVADLVLR